MKINFSCNKFSVIIFIFGKCSCCVKFNYLSPGLGQCFFCALLACRFLGFTASLCFWAELSSSDDDSPTTASRSGSALCFLCVYCEMSCCCCCCILFSSPTFTHTHTRHRHKFIKWRRKLEIFYYFSFTFLINFFIVKISQIR